MKVVDRAHDGGCTSWTREVREHFKISEHGTINLRSASFLYLLDGAPRGERIIVHHVRDRQQGWLVEIYECFLHPFEEMNGARSALKDNGGECLIRRHRSPRPAGPEVGRVETSHSRRPDIPLRFCISRSPDEGGRGDRPRIRLCKGFRRPALWYRTRQKLGRLDDDLPR